MRQARLIFRLLLRAVAIETIVAQHAAQSDSSRLRRAERVGRNRRLLFAPQCRARMAAGLFQYQIVQFVLLPQPDRNDK